MADGTSAKDEAKKKAAVAALEETLVDGKIWYAYDILKDLKDLLSKVSDDPEEQARAVWDQDLEDVLMDVICHENVENEFSELIDVLEELKTESALEDARVDIAEKESQGNVPVVLLSRGYGGFGVLEFLKKNAPGYAPEDYMKIGEGGQADSPIRQCTSLVEAIMAEDEPGDHNLSVTWVKGKDLRYCTVNAYDGSESLDFDHSRKEADKERARRFKAEEELRRLKATATRDEEKTTAEKTTTEKAKVAEDEEKTAEEKTAEEKAARDEYLRKCNGPVTADKMREIAFEGGGSVLLILRHIVPGGRPMCATNEMCGYILVTEVNGRECHVLQSRSREGPFKVTLLKFGEDGYLRSGSGLSARVKRAGPK